MNDLLWTVSVCASIVGLGAALLASTGLAVPAIKLAVAALW